MIIGFASKETEKIWTGQLSRKLPQEIQKTARRKLRMLNNAQCIEDLKIPPNNRLEMLKGNRKGQFSIRINVQGRICFTWEQGNSDHIAIVDYH
ncbi:MAG: type II toxin-antitoxin system RelE/ParE family toxin [Sphaerochaetaceae bacterium]|nr:type II toxin-antitoxin system RelE/ParE family toxin [Sphaerochaetaceae bacterium]